MRKTIMLTLLLVVMGAACGSSDEDESASSSEAVAEIAQIKALLDEGLAQYRAGDEEAADTTVGDAYLEHFEQVEDPLGERDHELMEDLEHRISTEIREAMKADAPADEVAQLVSETKSDLDLAKTKLQEGD